eukprot:c28784_g2_i1 orf=1048-1245(+)
MHSLAVCHLLWDQMCFLQSRAVACLKYESGSAVAFLIYLEFILHDLFIRSRAASCSTCFMLNTSD